jgi:hypothetical protein
VGDELERSRAAREIAEAALVRVVHHYGGIPEIVVLGGLVPELLCSGSDSIHAGTTDVDVQVNLELASGSVNAARLEAALLKAGFSPTKKDVWRWATVHGETRMVVKFELLADDDSQPAEVVFKFNDCAELGAVNLRGTGFASRDVVVRKMRGEVDGAMREVDVNVTGLAGFLLAKAAAARARGKRKDWYDVAFVLLHNNEGGVEAAAQAVLAKFKRDLSAMRRTLDELESNFRGPSDQGAEAYAEQMRLDHPDRDEATLRADAVLAVASFHRTLFAS